LVLVAGCFEQQPGDGSLKCAAAPAQPCPGGYYCADDNTCWRTGHAPDLSVMLDGGHVDDLAGRDLAVPDGAVVIDSGIPDLQCVNLQCQRTTCDGAGTALSGTVYTPSGKLPLPGVVVYVPNQTPDPMPNGIASGSCPACYATVTGSPVTLAITDVNGSFTLQNVPAGDNVPLVMQVGRWRRQVTVPHVAPCALTVVDPTLTHLPRNRTEGDIPHIAIATASADVPECLLRVAGIDDSEFVRPGDPGGRIHLYTGTVTPGSSVVPDGGVDAGATDQELWSDASRMGGYDLLIYACTGNTGTPTGPQLSNLGSYTGAGGRVYLTHWGLVWLAEFPGAATIRGGAFPPTAIATSVDTGFDGGAQLAQWMDNHVDGGQPWQQLLWRNDIPSIASSSQRWLMATTPSPNPSPIVQQFSFDTPQSGAHCGNVVFSDFHAYPTTGGPRFPQECVQAAVSPGGEAELIFMLFNQPTCVP
jgi:hypothetical protein